MVDIRPATADEVVLAFLQAEIDSPTERGSIVAGGLAHIRADRRQLIDHADLKNRQIEQQDGIMRFHGPA